MSTSTQDVRGWTIAYRTARKVEKNGRVRTYYGQVFHRIMNVDLTWDQARRLGDAFAEANTDIQVWTVGTLAAEQNGFVAAEDAGNVLVDSGKRIQMATDRTLAALGGSAEVSDYLPELLDADEPEARAQRYLDAGQEIPVTPNTPLSDLETIEAEFKFENLKAGDIVESRTGKRYRLTETDDVRPGHHLWWAVPTTGSGRKRRLGRRDFTIEGGWMLDTEGGFPDEQQAADEATAVSARPVIVDYGVSVNGRTKHLIAADNFVHLGAHRIGGALCTRPVRSVIPSRYIDPRSEPGTGGIEMNGLIDRMSECGPCRKIADRYGAITREQQAKAEHAAVQAAFVEQDRLGRDRTDGDAFERFEAAHAEQASRERVACEGMRPGHVHCKHGHVHDCPDPGNCEVIWPAECAECAQHVLTDEIMPMLTLRKGDVIQATLINGETIHLQLSFSPTLPTHPRKAGQYVVAGVRVDTGISHYTGQQYIHGHGITIIHADREQQVTQVAIPEPPADPQLAEINQAVSHGVAVLDALRPGWWRRLDVGRLDVASGSMCVLAQLREGPVGTLDTDNPYDDVRTMLLDELMADTRAAVRPEDYEWSISHGFSKDVRWEGDCWDQLTDAWTDVVVARRVADRPQDRADDAAAEREQLLTGIDLSDISVFAVLARAQFESAGSRAIFDGAGQSADTGERYGSDPGRLTFLAGLGLLDVRTVDGYAQVMLLDKGVRLARCLGISPRP